MRDGVKYGICTLCEAGCGIEVELEDGRAVSVRGDKADGFSKGYVCPKATALIDLHEDPDRLRRPMIREEDGRWREVSWEKALHTAAEGLQKVRERYGNDALAIYQGNPTVHNLGLMLFAQPLFRKMGTRNLYSPSSVDQGPHMLAALEMFGSPAHMPVVDIDRTDCLIVLGANPVVSNGSIMTAPDMRGRLKALKKRGGKLIVIDPRRTQTARLADEHHFIRPGTDALLLMAMIHTLFEADRVKPSRGALAISDGLSILNQVSKPFSPEIVAETCQIPAQTIRTMALEFADARRSACYGRLGVCLQPSAAVAAWLVYALNIVAGRMDQIGGLMYPAPLVDVGAIARMLGMKGHDRWRSRVRGLPELAGEFPIATLADEINQPGQGQVKALLTSAGNPALSAPNGPALEAALGKLDFMVSIDGYINETTRHANVILPPVSQLQRPHFDVALTAFAIRNVARWADPILPKHPDERHDWEIVMELGLRMMVGNQWPASMLCELIRGPLGRLGPEGILDILIRIGPKGAGLGGSNGKGWTLEKLRRETHGVDMGPLEPRAVDVLETPNRRIQLAPERFVKGVEALREQLQSSPRRALLLIGRRHLRSNNSWMHNSQRLVRGKDRCTLLMHPEDAQARSLEDGQRVEVASQVGAVEVTLEVSDEVMPGVVSLPHGWGHHRQGTQMGVAQAHAGVSVNDLTDDQHLDPISGNAALNTTEVNVRAAG